MSKKKSEKPKIIYLPPVYDPKKFREGILEICKAMDELEQSKASKEPEHESND